MHKRAVWIAAALIGLMTFPVLMVAQQRRTASDTSSASQFTTATPIKHLVVIFDENTSFDHYFGTYPNAANPTGEPSFYALRLRPGRARIAVVTAPDCLFS